MGHSDDAYAAMLLTMALSPDKEEYARPFNTQEFRRIEAAAKASPYEKIGKLLEVDISGMMMYMGLTDEEGYRAYTLLHRDMPLAYAIEEYRKNGVEVVTTYDADYPDRLARRLSDAAPPFLYRCGDGDILTKPAIAILGISGVRTTPQVRETLQTLAAAAARHGYAIITGGEPGVSRLVAGCIADGEGCLLEILGGGLNERMQDGTIARLIREQRAALLSTEHPDALLTVSHATSRNKLIFAMAQAAFVFNTDGRRGELDALASRTCDWIYAWNGFEGNRPLFSRGATPFSRLQDGDVDEMFCRWSRSEGQQLNMFDML